MDIFKPVLLKFWSITEKMDEKRIASLAATQSVDKHKDAKRRVRFYRDKNCILVFNIFDCVAG